MGTFKLSEILNPRELVLRAERRDPKWQVIQADRQPSNTEHLPRKVQTRFLWVLAPAMTCEYNVGGEVKLRLREYPWRYFYTKESAERAWTSFCQFRGRSNRELSAKLWWQGHPQHVEVL